MYIGTVNRQFRESAREVAARKNDETLWQMIVKWFLGKK